MAQLMTTVATMVCSFGAVPNILAVLPVNGVTMGDVPTATIMDYVPMLNVLPFGMCSSPSNPMVAAATAQALGAPTPMPCIPVTLAPWMPGVPTTRIGGIPALGMDCHLACAWGGVIAFIAAARTEMPV